MIGKCSAMQTVLNGFLRYRANLRGELLEKFKVASVDLNPQAVMVTCVDSRILASRITQANPGEILITRNPGNLVPNYNVLPAKTSRPEEAALELACLHDHVDTIVVAGHADCKAMNLVHDNRDQLFKPAKSEKESLLKSWLMANSAPTIKKYSEFEKNSFKKTSSFSIVDGQKFEAYIDPENEYGNNDKFSMINTLVQLENLKHYSFLKEPLETNKVRAYALWLDIYNGDILIFSFKEKRFVKLNDNTYERLVSGINAA
ncbi:beta carbonic anhydrase 1 [Brachionus plicatilis]|uniref:Carbonic anhydrase n=1 Tax=Brachionus plicatilis TaxID=10195 RepID=A0A3M7QQ35_BRAPC|nr:beta carbonic anhydrase 1 [Brachionus plicatilis]